MIKQKDKRRSLITKLKKGKIGVNEFIGVIKYNFNQEERDYILKKSPERFTNIAYNNPLPKDENDICKVSGYFNNQTSLIFELSWYFDVLKKYANEINTYLEQIDDIEVSILNNSYEECNDLLDKLNESVCHSFFALQTEFYINEINNNSKSNIEIIKKFLSDKNSSKLILLLDYSRIRLDKSISSWQYDSAIEQHRKQYTKETEHLIEYVNYKLDPIRFEEKLTQIPFSVYFDSDFSIIDRYNSLKNLLVSVLFEEDSLNTTDRQYIIERLREFENLFNDEYWEKCLLLIDESYKNINTSSKGNSYIEVQDLYLNGNYEEVINKCNLLLKKQPNFSDIYIFYSKSLIFLNKNIADYLDNNTELFEILQLIINVLLKKDNYISNRDKLLDKYYSISHFDFSTQILEFLYNEFKLNSPVGVKYLTYLKSKVFRYNSYSLFRKEEKYNNLEIDSLTNDFLKQNLECRIDTDLINHFFQVKLRIGILLYQNKIDIAIEELNKFKIKFEVSIKDFNFIDTWFNKTSLNCYFKINDLKKVSNLIVLSYFKNLFAYDHFFDQKFIDAFENEEDDTIFEEIAIPILFEIYNQPQSLIYDRIADFLIYYDIKKPSQIIDLDKDFELKFLIHFLEKVCIKDNIQDSPYLNTIEELESERIRIINILKQLNPNKTESYNSEILTLTKDASLRKGLLQIHESRIYVDTSNIKKHLKIEVPEIFDRYLELIDISYSAISALKLNDEVNDESIVVTFYLKEAIPIKELQNYLCKKDLWKDPNVVTVPVIRFNYFLNIFNMIRKEFIYNEDYGFKSFLSMRIRHGTFSNVLRSIFDNYNLISSKEFSIDEYKEIEYWNDNLKVKDDFKSQIQFFLKDFSRKIDLIIESGLAWVNVKKENEDNSISGLFDFNFSKDEMYELFHNRMGKIDNYDLFLEETFNVLYERLGSNLKVLRLKINDELSESFLTALENLQNNISSITKKDDQFNPIEQNIISCKTDLQLIISSMVKWFKVTENQYIEEFPIDMIVQNSLDYINSIHTNAINNATVNSKFVCESNFRGKYFENFGDMLINIFDNIVSKNKDLGDKLEIDIFIRQINQTFELIITNNISNLIDKKILKERVDIIIKNIEDYKKKGIDSSFEEGSGFLKICKCIAVDLERNEFELIPRISKNNFEVKMKFELNNLII